MWRIKLTEEQSEILKNPHDNSELFTIGLLEDCGFNTDMLEYGSTLIHNTEDCCFWANFDKESIITGGLFELWYIDEGRRIRFLENCFKFPLLPTKEEHEMFYIEHELEYPIPVYEGGL